MVLTLKGRSAPPNPNIFPPSPPPDSESTLLSNVEPLKQLPDSDIFKERPEPSVNDGGKQQPILCPYFLKNPHLVPEHSLCRLKGFENICMLRKHIKHNHKLALQPVCPGETELEEFEEFKQIWKQIFINHQGSIPHPRLCNREFLRKQQNLRVIEMYETYILAQLNDEPGTAARLGRIFDGFRQKFSSRTFGSFFLPETGLDLPQSKELAPEERLPEECDTHPELKTSATAETTPEAAKYWANQSIDATSETSDSDCSERAPSNSFSTLTESAREETTDAGDETNQASGSSSQLSVSNSIGMSSRSGDGKRKSTGPGRHDNNGGGGKRKKSDQPDDEESTSQVKRLSCPYRKRYPAEQSKSNSCSNPPGFRDVNRVKEHIYRVHHPCDECPRCFLAFESLESLQIHLASEERCEKVTKEGRPKKQSITHDQQRRLKNRPRLKGLSLEEQWRKVYRIIFDLADDDETPSPYYEQPKEDLDRLLQLIREELSRRGQPEQEEFVVSVVRGCIEKLHLEVQETKASSALENEAVVEPSATIQEGQGSILETVQQQRTEVLETRPEPRPGELPSTQTTGFDAQSMGGLEWSADVNMESLGVYMENLGPYMGNIGEFPGFHSLDHQE